MRFPNPFSVEFWGVVYDCEPTPAELGFPKRGLAAVKQAHYSHLAVENDRAELRADLMRQRRELREDLEMVDRALDDLDALRILERKS